MKKLLNYIYLVPVIIMGLTLPYKVAGVGKPYLIDFFNSILPGYGKIILGLIGIPELAAIVMLMIPRYRFKGAAQTCMIMLGALVTHIHLEQYDSLFVQALITMACAIYIVSQADPIRKLL